MSGIKKNLKKITPAFLYGWYAGMRRVFVRFIYRGNTYFCPLCGRHYRQFLADGSTEAVWKELQIAGGVSG